MIQLLRTTSANKDFIQLTNELDAFLRIHDGEAHSFYSHYNKIDTLKFVVVACLDAVPVGCGAIKHFTDVAMEVKRMYVLPTKRNEGIATVLLKDLENWTTELKYKKCLIETGSRLPEAIQLYKKNGYQLIPNYGQYIGVDDSLCFEKVLNF